MIRVFVGTSPNHEDAEMEASLEWSLRRFGTDAVEITWMKLRREGFFSGWDTSTWATPFTPFRWAVPELCGFRGRAIYVDVDFLFLEDPRLLFEQPIPEGKIALTKNGGSRTCVMVWDCERARGKVPAAEMLRPMATAHAYARKRLQPYFAPFSGAWNCLDGEDLPIREIEAVHFTAMRHQPHLARANARLSREGRRHWFDGAPARHWREDLIDLFERTLAEAKENGFTVESRCRDPLFGAFAKRSLRGLGPPSWAGRAPAC